MVGSPRFDSPWPARGGEHNSRSPNKQNASKCDQAAHGAQPGPEGCGPARGAGERERGRVLAGLVVDGAATNDDPEPVGGLAAQQLDGDLDG